MAARFSTIGVPAEVIHFSVLGPLYSGDRMNVLGRGASE